MYQAGSQQPSRTASNQPLEATQGQSQVPHISTPKPGKTVALISLPIHTILHRAGLKALSQHPSPVAYSPSSFRPPLTSYTPAMKASLGQKGTRTPYPPLKTPPGPPSVSALSLVTYPKRVWRSSQRNAVRRTSRPPRRPKIPSGRRVV